MTAVTARGEAFPPHPVRGVRARYVLQGGCGPFADAVVDFEPWEEGVHLEVAAGATVYGGAASQEDLARYHAALAEGVRAELAEQLPDATVALALVVHRTGVHDVDTSEYAYRRAGQVAVREVLALLGAGGASR
ncbi:hypothetical protein AB0A71_05355 [Kitasatospora aureofaciens]|uniref:hypothetical protein n=1 Tax=Kitasatospora aureofaciens TaxID=1894 RepID=UPI00340D92F7